jgi:hypothetical protein
MNPLLKPELMQIELDKPWVTNQVSKALSNMLYWVRNGYQLSPEQCKQLGYLWGMVVGGLEKGEDDENRYSENG